MVYGYQRLKVQKELEIGNTDQPDLQLTLKKMGTNACKNNNLGELL